MNLTEDDKVLNRATQLLNELFPSPENELNNITMIAGYTPEDSERYVKIRRLTLEIDDLYSQLRWHILQLLIILLRNPEIQDIQISSKIDRNYPYMPTGATLLLRQYVSKVDNVAYIDPKENRHGKPVSGWIFHMFIDNVISRAISILDRIAHLVAVIGNVDFPQDKVYFRSGKMKTIHSRIETFETGELYRLSQDEFLTFLIDYRDGFSHQKRQYSFVAGPIPTDTIINSDNQRQRIADHPLLADDLMAFINGGYYYLNEAIYYTNKVFERHLSEFKK